MRNGTIRNAQTTTTLPHPDDFYPVLASAATRDTMEICVFARDREHAIKIANERRAIHIANGTWGVNPKSEEEDER